MTATATVEPAGKRKLFALLLWLFLGVWGGHDFYAGKKWLGVAHVLLFFAWLWMLFFGVLIPINGYEFFAFLILLVPMTTVRHDVRRASRAADIVQVRRMLPLVVL